MIDISSVSQIDGPNLTLRLIQPSDAEYVYELRTNPVYNRHLSEVRGTVEMQRQWIEDYKARESEGAELYYVIERKDKVCCGLIRLYDIDAKQFTWGSWVLDGNKTPKAALESAVLSFAVGFNSLGCDLAQVDVRLGNTHAEAFYRRLGMRETNRTAQDIFFEYPRSRFETNLPEYLKTLNGN